MEKIKLSFLAGLFSFFTIGVLSALTYKTDYGIFLIASFGSTMVILYGYPDSPFAQPKNIFFGHLLTSFVGVIFVSFVQLPLFIILLLGLSLVYIPIVQQYTKLVFGWLATVLFILSYLAIIIVLLMIVLLKLFKNVFLINLVYHEKGYSSKQIIFWIFFLKDKSV